MIVYILQKKVFILNPISPIPSRMPETDMEKIVRTEVIALDLPKMAIGFS